VRTPVLHQQVQNELGNAHETLDNQSGIQDEVAFLIPELIDKEGDVTDHGRKDGPPSVRIEFS